MWQWFKKKILWFLTATGIVVVAFASTGGETTLTPTPELGTEGDWTELAIQVGDGCSESGCPQDGDILFARHAGWGWGVKEREKWLIVRVPKLATSTMEEINYWGKYDERDELGHNKEQYPHFSYDYTVEPKDVVDEIRSSTREKVLEKTDKEFSPSRKSGEFSSAIPDEKRYAIQPPSKLARWMKNTFYVQAATVVNATFADGGGNNCPSSSATACDYSSPRACESGEGGDLVTADEQVNCLGYDDGGDFAGTGAMVFVDGNTTDSTRYFRFAPADDNERHNGTSAAGGIKCDRTNNGDCFDINDTDTVIEGWQMVLTGDTNFSNGVRMGDIHSRSTIDGNVIWWDSAKSSNRGILVSHQSSSGTKIRNNIIFDFPLEGIIITGTGGVSIENNTVVDNTDDGIENGDAAADITSLKNNLAQGNGTDYAGSFDNTSNNISEDATSPDASYQSTVVTFEDEAGDDFHLASSDTAAVDEGADLSGSFTDDIDDDTRPQGSAFDIGADELIAAAAAAFTGVGGGFIFLE